MYKTKMAWEPIRKFLLIAYESGRKYWKWRKVKTWTSHRSFEISLCSFKWLWKNLNDQGSVGEALTQPTSPVFFTFFKIKAFFSRLLQPILQDAWFIHSFFFDCLTCSYVYDTVSGTIGRNKNDMAWLFYPPRPCNFRIWKFSLGKSICESEHVTLQKY